MGSKRRKQSSAFQICTNHTDQFDELFVLLFLFYAYSPVPVSGVILSSGERWREQRKVVEFLRECGLGKHLLAEKIQQEVVEFLKGLESENGTSFNPIHLVHRSIANIICSVVFGKRCEHDDVFSLKCLAALESNIRDVGGDTTILNFMPFLRFLSGDLFHLKRVNRNASLVKSFC